MKTGSQVLEKHLAYGTSAKVPEEQRINEEQAQWARGRQYDIVRCLRFPHNIDRFCSVHLPQVQQEGQIYQAIELAKEIEKATSLWVEERPLCDRWFVLLLALFPPLPRSTFESIFRLVATELGFQTDDVSRLSKRNAAYVSPGDAPSLSHPSYVEALQEHLQETYSASVGRFVDAALQVILQTDLTLFCACDAADYGWPRPTPEGGPSNAFDNHRYLSQMSKTHRHLRDSPFRDACKFVSPYHQGEASLLLVGVENSDRGQLMFLPTQEGSADYYVSMKADDVSVQDEVTELSGKALDNGFPFKSQSVRVNDLAQRSPLLHALRWMKDDVEEALKLQVLEPSPAMAHLYLQQALEKLHKVGGQGNFFDHYDQPLPADPQRPFGEEEFEKLARVWDQCQKQGPPSHWQDHPQRIEAWKAVVAQDAGVLLAARTALTYLLKHGGLYNGPLFVAPDRPGPQWGWRNFPYSDQGMKALMEHALLSLDESYRKIVERHFSPLAPRFARYGAGPLRVVGTISYFAFGGYADAELIFLPNSFKTRNNQTVELYVQCDETPHPQGNPPSFGSDIVARMDEARAGGYLWTQHSSPHSFYDPIEFADQVYNWLKEDFKTALKWEDIGNSRWRQRTTSEDATCISLASDGTHVLPIFDLTWRSGLWEMTSWKRLLR